MKKGRWRKWWAVWALCALFACALFPASGLAAAEALYQPAFAGHYGRSDLRAYLNGGLRSGLEKNFRAESSLSSGSAPFEQHFAQGELAAVRPSTIGLYNPKTGETEQLTDRFYLPACSAGQGTLSWGEADGPAEGQDASHLIPQSYWADSAAGSWVRSAAGQGDQALFAERQSGIGASELTARRGVAAICRVDGAQVHFAAMADARSIMAAGGAAAVQMQPGREGQEAPQSGYGMYLKTLDETAFSVKSYQVSENRITLKGLEHARKGAYVVLCAYPSQGKSAGYPVLMAAQPILSDNQAEIALATDGMGQDAARLSSYTWRVWMETPASEAEAFSRATVPVQLGRNLENPLVLAQEQALGASWGTPSGALEPGADATNQVLYFGRDQAGQPLEWWICGREGEETAPGRTLVLYQKRAAGQEPFNSTAMEYAGTGVQFPEEIVVTYGQTLSEGVLVGGSGLGTFSVSAQENLSSRPGVSDSGVMISVEFIAQAAADYEWNRRGAEVLTKKVALRVLPAAAGEVDFPSEATVRYGQSLADAQFFSPEGSGKYAFVSSSLVLEWEQNGQSFDMAYYPGDTVNFDYTGVSGWDEARGAVVRRVRVNMLKGKGLVATPLPDPVEYDPAKTLADIPLPAGWSWEDGGALPTVGNDGYAAVFTPQDTDNYDYASQSGWDAQTGTIRRVVPLVVAKVEPQVQAPALEAQEYRKGARLEELPLPEGWSWAEPDAALRLGTQSYVAVYTPEDSENYSQVAQAVQIEVRPGGLAQEALRWALYLGIALLGVLTVCAVALIKAGMIRKKRAEQ